MFVCACVRACVHMRVCAYICVCMSYLRMCACMSACVCMRVCAYAWSSCHIADTEQAKTAVPKCDSPGTSTNPSHGEPPGLRSTAEPFGVPNFGESILCSSGPLEFVEHRSKPNSPTSPAATTFACTRGTTLLSSPALCPWSCWPRGTGCRGALAAPA